MIGDAETSEPGRAENCVRGVRVVIVVTCRNMVMSGTLPRACHGSPVGSGSCRCFSACNIQHSNTGTRLVSYDYIGGVRGIEVRKP